MDAVCILCKTPHEGNLVVARDIANDTSLDVIFITDQPYTPPDDDMPSSISFVHIPDDEPIQHGYQKSCFGVSFNKPVVSWDKALYYLGVVNTSHRFVWLLEEDVFIPSTLLMSTLTSKYNSSDLVACSHHSKSNRTWHHWYHVTEYIDAPWFYSKVCGVGVSRRLLDEVREFLKGKSRMPFIEGFLNTLAAHKNMTVTVAPELSAINCSCSKNTATNCDGHCRSGDVFDNPSIERKILEYAHMLVHPVKSSDLYLKLYSITASKKK